MNTDASVSFSYSLDWMVRWQFAAAPPG